MKQAALYRYAISSWLGFYGAGATGVQGRKAKGKNGPQARRLISEAAFEHIHAEIGIDCTAARDLKPRKRHNDSEYGA